MSLFIGIDSGTQGTKGIVLDPESGKTLAEARAPHPLINGLPPGHIEQNPHDWVHALETVLDKLAHSLGADCRRHIRGIGVSGQQHGFVPLDEEGMVIRPAKLWCDTSTVRECELLTEALGGQDTVLAKTGIPFLPGYTAPKILWLKRNEPEHYARLRHILLPHDYLNYFLTGNFFMEYGDASGTAIMDIRRRQWSQEVINAIDPLVADFLPMLSESHTAAGILTPELAKRFGFPPDVVVSAGGGDNMMGAIGTGNVSPGMVTASFGTSGTIDACSDRPVVDPNGEIAAFCSSTGGWLPLLCTMNVTIVTEQVRKLFNQELCALERDIASVFPGANGLLLLPYLTGERTPNIPKGTGVLLGLTPQTFDSAHIARAAMEGVTLGMNYGLQRLKRLGIIPGEIRVTGGGAKSAVWRQIMADIFDTPVIGMRVEGGAALGAALQAAWCVTGEKNKLSDLTAHIIATDEKTRALPNPQSVERYRKLQALQNRLSESLQPLFNMAQC